MEIRSRMNGNDEKVLTAIEKIRLSGGLEPLIDLINATTEDQRPVLILGETGAGKEVVAQAVHDTSNPHDNPLLKVEVAALSPGTFESDLFGYVQGAFTGANKDRVGILKKSHKHNLFLDEIGEITELAQVKLLRAIEHGEFIPVGGNAVQWTNARFIFATNRDIHREVAEGRFREDFYHRISAHTIEIPPLRDARRREAIPSLFLYLLGQADRANRRPESAVSVSAECAAALINWRWRGNVRELNNVAVSVANLIRESDTQTVEIHHLPDYIRQEYERFAVKAPSEQTATTKPAEVSWSGFEIPLEITTNDPDDLFPLSVLQRDQAKRLSPDFQNLKDFFGATLIEEALEAMEWNSAVLQHIRKDPKNNTKPGGLFRHILILGETGAGKTMLARALALHFANMTNDSIGSAVHGETDHVLPERTGLFSRFVAADTLDDSNRFSDFAKALLAKGESLVVTALSEIVASPERCDRFVRFLEHGVVRPHLKDGEQSYLPLPVIALWRTGADPTRAALKAVQDSFHTILDLDDAYQLDGRYQPGSVFQMRGFPWILKHLLTDCGVNPVRFDSDDDASVTRTIEGLTADAVRALAELAYPESIRDLALTLKASVKNAARSHANVLDRKHVVFSTTEPLDESTGAFAVIKHIDRFLLIYKKNWNHLYWPGTQFEADLDTTIRSTLVRGIRKHLGIDTGSGLICEPVRPEIDGQTQDALTFTEFSGTKRVYRTYRHFVFEMDSREFSATMFDAIGDREGETAYWVTEADIISGTHRDRQGQESRIAPNLTRFYPDIKKVLKLL
jgi:transcriptional regulator with GAF, ATPase, and Fis domain